MYNTEHFTHDELRQVTVNGQVYNRLPAHDLTEDILAEYFKVNFDTELLGMTMPRQRRHPRGQDGNHGGKARSFAMNVGPDATPGTFTDVNTGTVRSDFDARILGHPAEREPAVRVRGRVENFNIRMGYAELMSRPADHRPRSDRHLHDRRASGLLE